MCFLTHLACAGCKTILDADRLWNLYPECTRPRPWVTLSSCGRSARAGAMQPAR
jgi:hypothetical protein